LHVFYFNNQSITIMMKKLFVATLAVAIAGAVAAQPPRGGNINIESRNGAGAPNDAAARERYAQQRQALKDSLQLSAEQSVKYDSITAKYDRQQRELMQDADRQQGDADRQKREARRAKMDNINAARDAELAQVLTAAQKQKYDKLQEQRRKEREARRGGGNNGGRGRR
jgi:Spy/CpxP family protein refolding chaperone